MFGWLLLYFTSCCVKNLCFFTVFFLIWALKYADLYVCPPLVLIILALTLQKCFLQVFSIKSEPQYKEILQRTHISTTQDIFSDETLVSNSEYAQKKGSYEFCTLLNNLRSAGATQRCVERGGAYDLFSSVSHGATTVLWLVHRLVSLRTFIRHLNGPNVSLPSTAGVPDNAECFTSKRQNKPERSESDSLCQRVKSLKQLRD